ncbi:type I DNA topoisomerase [Candidatus Peregrinibacteria bacterium]|nr:type I DNA topoisomerase [Candidatus Peregrinibacteria bacterium]
MTKNLVIVESPTKAKLLQKFLGSDYTVLSSYGHIRDLPSKKSELSLKEQALPYATLAIDVENKYMPLYVSSPEKKKVISALKDKLDEKTTLWIASDEDREGEAIGWHIIEVLKPKKGNAVRRIVFHEITKSAILNAIENPRNLDMNLVNAQQARRILDRLVGYGLSPLLWKKIRFGLSAGRVQSVAVRLIVEREREIKAFTPEESWSLTAHLEKNTKQFEATFQKIDGKRIVLKNEAEAKAVLEAVHKQPFVVDEVEEKETKRNPSPPFTTSTLQQEASRKLGFSVKKTMQIAQQLYEGVSLGKGKSSESSGLITYMRTDSVNLSQKALSDAKSVIEKEYGKEYGLESPRVYKTKSKGAQEAHEAIRPTEISRKPDDVKSFLTPDQIKIYTLIWKRTVACQMAEAKLKNTAVDFLVEGKIGTKKMHTFRATGQVIIFPGFIKLYQEDLDDDKNEEGENILPPLKKGEVLYPEKIEPQQHFTKPPARYTEASLVKKLEEEGIGRPSTYAPTISTIMARGYVLKEGKALFPSDTAYVVNDFLFQHFPEIVDIKFTARMETDLDAIAEGEQNYITFLDQFYPNFHKQIELKNKTVSKADVVIEQDENLEPCPKCGNKLVVKLSRFGKFISCSTFPKCEYSRPLQVDEEKEAEIKALSEKFAGEKCEKCGSDMIVKSGRFGEFLACSKYPKCKTTKTIEKQLGMKCPQCKKGEVVEKRTRKGKVFWGCNTYPKCDYASWKNPKQEKDDSRED